MSIAAVKSICFEYINWRGQIATRCATPSKIWWGKTEHHSKPQWLMKAFDHDKGEERDFALSDCLFLGSYAGITKPECRGTNE